MTSMATTAAPYQNVFPSDGFPWWILLLVGPVIVAFLIAVFLGIRDELDGAVAMMIVFGTFGAILLGTFLYVSNPDNPNNLAWSAAVHNVKEKYNADLGNSRDNTDLKRYDEAKAYILTFPDGTKETYTIRFDRNTSEPFIVDGGGSSPTAEQLNQKAQQK